MEIPPGFFPASEPTGPREERPPLPVDDEALDMYSMALNPPPGSERTSLIDLLDLLAEMAGADGWSYHPHNLIQALIGEVRRQRAALVEERIARHIADHAAAAPGDLADHSEHLSLYVRFLDRIRRR